MPLIVKQCNSIQTVEFTHVVTVYQDHVRSKSGRLESRSFAPKLMAQELQEIKDCERKYKGLTLYRIVLGYMTRIQLARRNL